MGRRGLIVGGLLVVTCGVGATNAGADVIHLTTGRFLDGLIIKETGAEVTVQVANEGYLFLDRASIRAIERSDEETRKRLLAQWRQEATEARRREEAQQAFETAQRERGLVKYQGEWITAQELALIKDHQEEEARRQREEEAQRTAQVLQALQEENQHLRELVNQRQYLEVELQHVTRAFHTLQAENCRLQDLVQQQQLLLLHVGQHEHLHQPGVHRDLEAFNH